MHLNQSIQQKQTLKQQLTPKMIQMFRVFQLPYSDIVDEIKHERDDNVFIEIEQEDSLITQSSTRHHDQLNTQDISEYTKDNSEKSLHQFLLSQLKLTHVDEQQFTICSQLIDSLDHRGFIEDYNHIQPKLAKQHSVKPSFINKCLTIIQQFEPEGVGAKSLKDCFVIQLNHLDIQHTDLYPILYDLITKHLSKITPENHDFLATSLQIPLEGVSHLLNYFKQNFNPNPGVNFTKEKFNQHITPSFEVYFEDEKIRIINLEQKHGIKIKLSQKYLSLLNHPDTDEETKLFLKEKYKKAKELDDNLRNRYQTLQNILQFIFEKQTEFLKQGTFYLKPLLQKNVAQFSSMNPSVISRLLSSKYCRTSFGVFPLRFFCPRGFYGKTSVQLKHLISQYLTQHPTLSDQKISALMKNDGIPIARRTVTKYRHLLDLPSSFFQARSSEEK